jgi:hypothetical protein
VHIGVVPSFQLWVTRLRYLARATANWPKGGVADSSVGYNSPGLLILLACTGEGGGGISQLPT